MENNMQNVVAEKPKRKGREILIVVVLVLIAAAVLGVKYNMSSKVAKENALMGDLRNVRTSVQLYITMNKQLPPDLKSLISQKYTLGSKQGTYLSGIRVDKNNEPIDAFGNKINYDSRTGRVWAGAKKYENW